MKIPANTIKTLVEKFGPLILGSAPVVSAIRKVVADSRFGTDESRISNLEKTLELQAALNEKVNVQLKIVQALLENVQRSLKLLTIAAIATAIIAVVAISLALFR